MAKYCSHCGFEYNPRWSAESNHTSWCTNAPKPKKGKIKMNTLEKQNDIDAKEMLEKVYKAFDCSKHFQNIPKHIVRMMAEVAVHEFKPYIAKSNKLAIQSIETDMLAMDAITQSKVQEEK